MKTSVKIKSYLTPVITQKNIYIITSKYYYDVYNLVVGKMKDEKCGVPIKGFAESKSKMYTFITRQS